MTEMLNITPISSSLHLKMMIFTLCIIIITQILGFRSRQSGTLSSSSQILGICMFALWLIYNAYYFYPGNFSWEVSLPLHVCDLLGPISAIALISSNRKARAVLYFCALTLATQAIITPIGNQDPEAFRFWLYWLLHAGIISLSVFDLIVRHYKPNIKDLHQVFFFDIAYAVLITPFNIAFCWNYGYLGNSKPDTPTVIDFLGPWPERIFSIILIAIALQTLMYLPWLIYDRFSNQTKE